MWLITWNPMFMLICLSIHLFQLSRVEMRKEQTNKRNFIKNQIYSDLRSDYKYNSHK